MDNSIAHYLKENDMLGSLLSGLRQIQQWNNWLKECLEPDSVLTQHCLIVNRVNTSLIVIADNPHWVTRFRFHIPGLLVKLRLHPGLENIQAICCKVQPNYAPAAPLNRGPQQKLSLKNAELLREAASKISDKKLRLALEKIASHT